MATKNEITEAFMEANADRPMYAVLGELAELLGRPGDEGFARGYYTFGLRQGWPGNRERNPDAKPAKAEAAETVEAAPVVHKAKVQKPRTDLSGIKDKPKVTDKTVEEIQDIKNKALKRVKKAKSVEDHPAKTAQSAAPGVPDFDPVKALAEVAAVNEDLENFQTPDHLVA